MDIVTAPQIASDRFEWSTLAATRAPHPGTKTGYFGLGDFVRILRRRLGLIVFITLIGMAVAVVAIVRTTPVYQATATVVVMPPDQRIVPELSTTIISPTYETDIETKVEMLRSRKLMIRAAGTMHLENDPEFASSSNGGSGLGRRFLWWFVPPPPADSAPAERAEQLANVRNETVVDRLIDAVDVTRVGRSSTIKITASSSDPQKAALIANRIVQTYLKGQIKDSREERESAIEDLSQRVSDARNAVQQADAAAAMYRKSHGLLTSSPEKVAAAQVMQRDALLAQARSDAALNTRRAMGGAGTSVLSAALHQQEAALTARLTELSSFYGPGYPEVAKLRAQLASLQPRMAEERSRIRAELATEAAATRARQSVVSAGIGQVLAQGLDAGTNAVPLLALERTALGANTAYMALLNTLNTRIGTPADEDPDISIVSRASVPTLPSEPIPQRALAVALLASLALGVLIGFVVETLDTTIRTADQVRRLLGIPTFAMVPELKGELDGRPMHATITRRPRSRFTEAVRNVLIELEAVKVGRKQVVLVTSPLDGEGKNTIATSLAAAASAIGRRAVVVDFDLRHPAAEPDAAIPGHGGVVAYLSGIAPMDDLPVVAAESRFEMIDVGSVPVDPGALIASPRLPLMIDQLRAKYDLVILNAPPILPVRDAKTLAELSDATILVLRWGRSRPEAARVAMEVFERPIAGAVINRVNYARHAGRRYGDAIHLISKATHYDEPRQSEHGGLRAIRQRMTRMLHLA
jgi:succinoglycan biosynthesis transport protein ExoP